MRVLPTVFFALALTMGFGGGSLRAAQVPPVTTAEVPGPTGSADTPGRAQNIARPIFFGLIAFAFLTAAGLAAVARRGAARSRRPPRA